MSDHPRIPVAGVIGSPIAHSRSPALFRHWLNSYGIAGHYVPLDVNQADLETVLRTLPRMGFVGVNITIPHKERALEIADVVSDRAALIGAANTLILRADGKIHADNTDGYGFIANLNQHAPNWVAGAGPAAVLGAGGAARAIVASLLETGAPEIRISNRTRARAEALRTEFGARVVVYDWVQAGNMIEGANTVVNTTSLGMTGKADFRVPLDALSPGTTCCDLVYSPLRTRFLVDAEEAGCVVVDGLGMLLHQAVPGFERWFGQRPEVTDALRDAVLSA
ncbi:shikimate dehydrogenase [Thioclava sp. BHET1]|uniref:Shikimate dehydrogenase (NADP(+)) n=1 Tax=Thioclava dalianensis TaxID=1185766 RepID=A0A074TAW1_9RHOB|nr:shikimate dehydrogenase [Thioclava dalianensis]KEP68926.1 shikimate dehydrogenase [Thioclava dalianensis]TMV94170.1 shikimate dehydrogenase [Thioclava sp. BHET1]SFN35139.1 shikimate dehydrogenase [Thioclava dalianensis]